MSSSVEVRDAILRAATSLFAQYGFKKASVDEVARLARIGKGTIYQHFESKEALFAEVIRHESETLIQGMALAMKRAPTLEDKVRVFVRHRIARLKELANLHRVSSEAIIELFPLAEEARQQFFEREIQLLTDVFEEGARSGVFELQSPRLLALAIISCLRGMEVVLLQVREPPDLGDAIEEALKTFFKGLKPAVRQPLLAP